MLESIATWMFLLDAHFGAGLTLFPVGGQLLPSPHCAEMKSPSLNCGMLPTSSFTPQNGFISRTYFPFN